MEITLTLTLTLTAERYDATAPVFGAAAVGGGAVVSPVYSDGANWIVG